MAGKRNMTGAQRCLLQAIVAAHNGIIEWPKKPFRDATLHALQEKKWVRWFTTGWNTSKLQENIQITEAGIQAALDAGIMKTASVDTHS